MKAEPRSNGQASRLVGVVGSPSTASRVRWSSAREICDLLQVCYQSAPDGDELRFPHRKLRPGQVLYREGQPFEAVYLIVSGFFKVQMTDITGSERVIAFPARHDVLGLDGICVNRHTAEVRALTDCEVVAMPFRQVLTLSHACENFEQALYRAMSRELVCAHQGVPGVMRAEAKVARFIEAQTARYAALGYSAHRFLLVMTRRDIGSYLGLTLETVSRALSALSQAGVIAIRLREVVVLQPQALAHWQRHDDAFAAGKPEVTGDAQLPALAAAGWWPAVPAPGLRQLQ